MPESESNSTNPHAAPVCLVTGGSSGIGLAIAGTFARQGYRLAICGRRSTALRQAAEQIRRQQPHWFGEATPDQTCLTAVVDLTDSQRALNFAAQVFEQFGRVDVLVNNAAAAPLAAFDAISSAEFERTLDINVRSLFYLTQAVWRNWISDQPRRADQPGRTVINISSLAAVDPFPQFSIYGASKAWMDLMTLALAQEGEPHGIRICSLRPGAVETPLLRGLFPDFPADQCSDPQLVADLAWNCVDQPQAYPSGQAFTLPPLPPLP